MTDGFEQNTSGRRALRVGIDASLWYEHAFAFSSRASRGHDIGANPEIRLLFFRLANLSELPILPLFVFDGRQRPKVKRGSSKGKSGSHNLTQKMKEMLDVFGMEWRMVSIGYTCTHTRRLRELDASFSGQALGEAEAELAHLNRTGVVDIIMTDDGDALLFGAKVVIKKCVDLLVLSCSC